MTQPLTIAAVIRAERAAREEWREQPTVKMRTLTDQELADESHERLAATAPCSGAVYHRCVAYGLEPPTQQQIDGARGFYRLAMIGSAIAMICRIEQNVARIQLGQWPDDVEAP